VAFVAGNINASNQFVVLGFVRTGDTGPSTTINATDDTTTNASHYPVFVAAAGSNQTAEVSTTKLFFNPSTGTFNATLFNTLSDITKKENILTLSNAMHTVNQLRGVSFDWKDNKNHSMGVVAQEIEKVIPYIVSTDNNGIKSVSYDSIVGLLIEGLKEQQQHINNLEIQINKLCEDNSEGGKK
jgi:hypothetical protein